MGGTWLELLRFIVAFTVLYHSRSEMLMLSGLLRVTIPEKTQGATWTEVAAMLYAMMPVCTDL